jgi:hypothetical protein
MGTGLALDSVIMEMIKLMPMILMVKRWHVLEIVCWGLVSQLAADANAKISFVQTYWPGATNDISCFCGTHLFHWLKTKQLPSWMHIVADKAYLPLSAKCNFKILTPYILHQRNAAK